MEAREGHYDFPVVCVGALLVPSMRISGYTVICLLVWVLPLSSSIA
jgi:hypothetical protein